MISKDSHSYFKHDLAKKLGNVSESVQCRSRTHLLFSVQVKSQEAKGEVSAGR
jgi:hypothetical protein